MKILRKKWLSALAGVILLAVVLGLVWSRSQQIRPQAKKRPVAVCGKTAESDQLSAPETHIK